MRLTISPGCNTDLLESGSPVVVEFMPFVCCVAYIILCGTPVAEQRARTHLEQLQSSLNLQVNQAVREIEGLRESQRKTRAYRHDLRHHLQYLDACSGERPDRPGPKSISASIDAEIEASRLTVYCENEAANLILSALPHTGEKPGNVSLSIHAQLPHVLPIGGERPVRAAVQRPGERPARRAGRSPGRWTAARTGRSPPMGSTWGSWAWMDRDTFPGFSPVCGKADRIRLAASFSQ